MTPTTPAIVQALVERLGQDAVLTDAATLAARQHDYWVLAHLRRRLGQLGAPPTCVVRPATTADVSAVLTIADARRVPVVPYGAGSGVCGGVLPPPDAIVLDLSRMDRVLALDETSLLVTVQPGMRGDAFEAALDARGYSMGHFPQSIAVSTVGGWVATRASGQFSTRYGNIEDMLAGGEVVLASGETVRFKPVPRSATGPDLRALFLGSEGTLGVLTELTLRVHPRPEHRRVAAWAFPDVHAGLEAIRLVMRAGWRPAVLRLYDEIETARQFSADVPGGCLLLALAEGPRAGAEVEAAAVAAIATAGGGTAASEATVAWWLDHRNTVPSWDRFFEQGIVVDTIEVAASWRDVHRLYDGTVGALRAIPEVLVASAHSSHSYLQGTCLYVSVAIRPPDLEQGEALYRRCWDEAMRATLAAGGTISHHHGIGRVRRGWLAEELGSAYPLLRTLKHVLDPHGILNPGVLL
jgi:alkyldihydroxyacetonephosphate synthase